MSRYKYAPWAAVNHRHYDPILDKWWFRLWNHWLNPLGNWHEPLPFPYKRLAQAEMSWMNKAVYWNVRNFAHNFTHFWVGVVPIGDRYEWISPIENGWQRRHRGNWHWWCKRNRISLPYYKRVVVVFGKEIDFSIGWKSDGCLGFNFRSND